MRRIIFILTAFALVTALGYFYITNKYHIDENAILTQIIPPAEKVAKILPQGSDLDKPFNIPEGFRLAVFADLNDVGSPRVLTFDSNGVLYVSIPAKGKIVALPDEDGDGVADKVREVLSDQNRPHGIVIHNSVLYVAETDKVMRWGYFKDQFRVSSPQKLFDLPTGGRHFSRTIKIYGDKLYTSVGSSCDVCEEKDELRSTLLQSNLDGSDLKVYASGLRNTVFFDFDKKGVIWGSDMGRDFLGDNLPPDELNIIMDGKDYGWPWCYGKRVYDTKFKPELDWVRSPCDDTQPSVFNYPAHVAPLGTTFLKSDLFSQKDNGDLLVSFHGSWNSSVPVGYKIVKLDVNANGVSMMEDFITGFLNADGEVIGRPVDLIFDDQGVLYISDDKANLIYILTKE